MTKNSPVDIQADLNRQADIKKAQVYQRFFKTGKGQYGEGDKFIGLTVPQLRAIAKKYSTLPLSQVKKLLQNKIHEYRLTALLILVDQYQKSDDSGQKIICDYYLKHIRYVNNWDLVDLSADKILGDFLGGKGKPILYKLAKSNNVWERRIAIIATFNFIKNNQFKETLKISEILLNDQHDLIHKAVGWMLREVGKRNQKVLESFLQEHYKSMPRTMLRYVIERFDEKKRKFYLNSKG
ncbi:MAG: alkylation repair enzyme protein [Candidatus Curtissbacteria bacterium GW2011_GWA1_41_11]|uniref:Alkylation repair enzyme protein n=1 Tax=Candidatus Curtissbacteria bacterium GW2011_GWA1_41_11 TaxID=1618409 RepID=A0A0G0UGK4_9BACT|nr:MAG: alkylation repair enzyme protein [Candidatus Curtissbacteria bacterium GW2011_GWA1_41_11]